MRKNRNFSRREFLIVAVMIILMAASVVTAQQKPRAKSGESIIELERGMGLRPLRLHQMSSWLAHGDFHRIMEPV